MLGARSGENCAKLRVDLEGEGSGVENGKPFVELYLCGSPMNPGLPGATCASEFEMLFDFVEDCLL